MPPEQFINSSRADISNDIYSFGIVLYELVSGRHPYLIGKIDISDQKQYWQYMFDLHSNKQPKVLDTPLWPILDRCISKEPIERFQKIEDLRDAFIALSINKKI